MDMKKAIIENLITGVSSSGGSFDPSDYESEVTAWFRFTVQQSPGNTIIEHTPTGSPNSELSGVLVFMQTVPTTSGVYGLDVKLGGSSVLASAFDLTGLTPATWTIVEIDPSDDGTWVNLPTPYTDLTVEVESDNGDLSGGAGLTVVLLTTEFVGLESSD